MEAFRHLGQKITHYPVRRPRGARRRRLTAEEDPLAAPMDHRELMVIVGTITVLLALGLLAALLTLGFFWA